MFQIMEALVFLVVARARFFGPLGQSTCNSCGGPFGGNLQGLACGAEGRERDNWFLYSVLVIAQFFISQTIGPIEKKSLDKMTLFRNKIAKKKLFERIDKNDTHAVFKKHNRVPIAPQVPARPRGELSFCDRWPVAPPKEWQVAWTDNLSLWGVRHAPYHGVFT